MEEENYFYPSFYSLLPLVCIHQPNINNNKRSMNHTKSIQKSIAQKICSLITQVLSLCCILHTHFLFLVWLKRKSKHNNDIHTLQSTRKSKNI